MKKALLLAPMSSVHERFNIANIAALSELGYEIHLAANFSVDEHAKSYKSECEKRGIISHDIPFSRHSLRKNCKYVKVLKKLLTQEKYDIVHAHTETGGLLLRLAMASKGATKYIYTAHGMSFYHGSSLKSQVVYKPIERYICRRMDTNIAINQEEYDCLRKWNKDTAVFVHGAGFDIDAIRTASSGADKRLELGIPTDRKIVLSVGELNDNKNHRVIIEALAGMAEEDRPYLLICGEGEKRAELLRLARERGCEKYLFLPGYRYDMPDIFKMSDLFVFPSYHEGLSFSLMQAMAAGLPVICSKIRGNVDLIENGVGGWLIDPDDKDLLQKKMTELLKDDNLSKRLGISNREKVALYDYSAVKSELIPIYS